jgi:hypothetical protein
VRWAVQGARAVLACRPAPAPGSAGTQPTMLGSCQARPDTPGAPWPPVRCPLTCCGRDGGQAGNASGGQAERGGLVDGGVRDIQKHPHQGPHSSRQLQAAATQGPASATGMQEQHARQGTHSSRQLQAAATKAPASVTGMQEQHPRQGSHSRPTAGFRRQGAATAHAVTAVPPLHKPQPRTSPPPG